MIVKKHRQKTADAFIESGQQDLNLRPLGPQPSALPSYAIPREQKLLYQKPEKKQPENIVRNIQKRKRTRRFRRSFQFFIKKNGPWHILAPRAVACDSLHLRTSAHLWHVSAFLCNREFLVISCYIKKGSGPQQTGPLSESNLSQFLWTD